MVFSNSLILLYSAALIALISTTGTFAKPALRQNADIQAALKAYEAIAPLPTPWHAILFVNMEKANAMYANMYAKDKTRFLSSFQYTEKNATALNWPEGSYAEMDATFGPPRLQFLSDSKLQLAMTASAGSKVISSFCTSYNKQTKECNKGSSASTSKDIANEVFITEVEMAHITETLTNGTLVLDLNSVTHWQFNSNVAGFDAIAGQMLAEHMKQKHTNKDYTLIKVNNVKDGILGGLIPTGVKYRQIKDQSGGANAQAYIALFIMTLDLPLPNDLSLPEKVDFIPPGRDFTMIIPDRHFVEVVREDMELSGAIKTSTTNDTAYDYRLSSGTWDTKVVLQNFGLKCSSDDKAVISGPYDVVMSLAGSYHPSTPTQTLVFSLKKDLPIVYISQNGRAPNSCDDLSSKHIEVDLSITFGMHSNGTISITSANEDKTKYPKPNIFDPNYSEDNNQDLKNALATLVREFRPSLPSLQTFPLVQYGLPDQSHVLFEEFNIVKDAIAFGKTI
eukprot:Nk52_evm35s355 gene=Nk52_evmTU35s355